LLHELHGPPWFQRKSDHEREQPLVAIVVTAMIVKIVSLFIVGSPGGVLNG